MIENKSLAGHVTFSIVRNTLTYETKTFMATTRQIVRDYTRSLSAASFNLQEINGIETQNKRRLHSLLVSLEKPSRAAIHDAISCLKQDTVETSTVTTVDIGAETLERAVMSKLVIGVYTESLQLLLDQSIELEDEVCKIDLTDSVTNCIPQG